MVIVDTPAPDAWDAYVAGRADASLYHMWSWRRVFERAFGHETVYLAAMEDAAIRGVLPLVVFRNRVFGRFAVSLPFVNYGGVCADQTWIAAQLVDQAASVARRLKLSHVELRHDARRFPEFHGRQHKVSMVLPLQSDAEAQWRGLDRKVRNQVRKAQGSGLTSRSGGAALLDRFYDVFSRNMRDLGTPVYSSRFFREVFDALPDVARVHLVEASSGVTAAAAVTLSHRGIVEVPWASSRREYLAQSPNNLLYWSIIQEAIAQGGTALDFGRSTPNEGTYRFKQQWGAQPRQLYWEYALIDGAAPVDLSPKNRRFEQAIAVWKHLPLAVTNRLGPHIVRCIP